MAIFPTPITQGISGFFRWWGGEMAACLPARLRERFGRTRRRLVIEVSEAAAAFTCEKGRESQRLGEISISSADRAGQREAAARILRKARLGAAEVILRVPREKVLRRLVDLPSAAAENLREVLGFEMDRHTPFKAEEVYFDYRLEGSDPERKRIEVDLVVIPRTVADRAARLATSWGIEPDRLAAGDEPDDGTRPFNLLPPGAARPRTGFGRRLAAKLAVLALVLLAVALYLPLKHDRDLLAAIEVRLAQVRAEAIQADGLKTQVAEIRERSRFVVERKRNQPGITELLDEVTRVLPDHTWVLKFGLRDGRLTLSGYSAKPSSLIGLLERSEMLSEVRFSSPVTMDQKIGLERFNLTAVLSGRDKK
ncbi:MAG: PilN domain-containing protein [Proteobacteria bacterium]|nr:PilN domain-containing protein [Pseudomonadota bacterium]